MEGMMTIGLRFIPVPAAGRPRTIAHALELLRVEVGFSELDTARISVVRISPRSKPAWSFALIYESNFYDKHFAVMLPSCATVQAIRDGELDRRMINVCDLHAAAVNADGEVQLADGSFLRAVETQPVNLPSNLSEQDCRIIDTFIKMVGGKDRIYRSLRQGIPLEYQEMVPDHRFVDFSAFRALATDQKITIPLLKAIEYQILKRFGATPSLAKISDTLRKIGIRTNQSTRD